LTRNIECALIGKWRIVEADLWDRDYLDLVEPAYITFEDLGRGEFAFGCVNGALDCEYSSRIIFFTWQGSDEMDAVGGDGTAELDDNGSIEIELRFRHGDEAILKAQKW
jgi:hypothetical protein